MKSKGVKKQGSHQIEVIEGEKMKKTRGAPKQPPLTLIIQTVKETIREEYNKYIEEHGEEADIQALQEMLTQEYIGKFQITSKSNQRFLNDCVIKSIIKLATEVILKRLEKELSKTTFVDEETKKQRIEGITEIVETLGDNIPEDFRIKIEEYLMSYKQKECGEKIVQEVTVEQKGLDSNYSTENQNIQEKEAEPKKVKKAKKVKKVQQTEVDKAAEVLYYEDVQKYTNNFQYLVQDRIVLSTIGSRGTHKFQNYEHYSRFEKLRQRLLQNMEFWGEEKAIKRVLNDEAIQLLPADKKILKQRIQVIKKEMER